jgi:hypothetical protein
MMTDCVFEGLAMGEDQDRFSRVPADGGRNPGFGFAGFGTKKVRDAGSGKMDVSIVVPLFNEEDNIALLCKAIDEALVGWGVNYEVILVDDGSRDRTFERAAEAIRYRRNFYILKMRRNHGQTTAMAAGIDFARGGVIVTMDGDLQNDPRDIPTSSSDGAKSVRTSLCRGVCPRSPQTG